MIKDGWVDVLMSWIRSGNPAIRLSAVTALENLMSDGCLLLDFPVSHISRKYNIVFIIFPTLVIHWFAAFCIQPSLRLL